jgi:uncharacterized protein (TIGR02145 family)
MKQKIALSLLLMAIFAIFTTCEKPERNNPWDEKANLDPASWAPQNLQIEDVSITEKKLTWTYDGDDRFEGFKLDRKKGDEPWQVAYQTFSKETRSWNDKEIVLDASLIYTYKLYAYAGNKYSDHVDMGIYAQFCGFTIIDSRDNNEYETVQIGNQCWLKENMEYLPSVSSPNNGSNTLPYYYVYGNEGANVNEAKNTFNYNTYGVIYNWEAAITACPLGWHLPTNDEWLSLIGYVRPPSTSGGKMKETGTSHWNIPNTGATNSSGFTGLPGGIKSFNGFSSQRSIGSWWYSTEISESRAWVRILTYDSEVSSRGAYDKDYGFSVRCIRD